MARSVPSSRVAALRRAAAQFPITFGPRLKRLREEAGLTQVDFAWLCLFSVRSLTRYENNMAEPGATVILRMAAVLAVEPGVLLGLR